MGKRLLFGVILVVSGVLIWWQCNEQASIASIADERSEAEQHAELVAESVSKDGATSSTGERGVESAAIVVSDASGAKLMNAMVHSISRGAVMSVPTVQPDSDGVLRTSDPERGDIAIVCAGYLTKTASWPPVGQTRAVVLDPGCRQRIALRSMSGLPVSGVPVILYRSNAMEAESYERASDPVLQIGSGDGSRFVARTGKDGVALFDGLTAGDYWVEVDTSEADHIVEDVVASQPVSVPGPEHTIRMQQICGVIMQVDRSAVVAVKVMARGRDSVFVTNKDVREMSRVVSARADFRSKFPGCEICIYATRHDGVISFPVKVLTTSGEVVDVDVPVEPLGRLRTPWVLSVGSSEVQKPSVATFRIKGYAATMAPDLRVEYVHGRDRFTVKAPHGRPVAVARTRAQVTFDLSVSAKSFQSQIVELKGEGEIVEIDVDPLYCYDVELVLPDGKKPLWSVLVYDQFVRGRVIQLDASVAHGRKFLWSDLPTWEFSARAMGFKADRVKLSGVPVNSYDGKSIQLPLVAVPQ